jgi:hypothetical protein
VIIFWPVGATPRAEGAVVVVANRTAAEVRFVLTPARGEPRPYAVASGDLAAIAVTRAAEIGFDAGPAARAADRQRRYRVEPNSAYYFADLPGGLDLKEIGLAAGRDDRNRPDEPQAPAVEAGQPPPRVLTVKILVDQKEVAVRQAWEKRLRGRIDAASKVLDHVCGVTLKVLAVEEWRSDEAATDVPGLLADFERRVPAHPARLAIGFTSQRVADAGDRRIGATRTALHDHILLREWRPPTEGGRIDVLLHELGHYLGAAHSPEADSVMRPRLGDEPQARGNARSGFDPVNALVMNLVAEEVFDRGITRLGAVGPATRFRLREIYGELARAAPDDPTPAQYLRLLDGPPAR